MANKIIHKHSNVVNTTTIDNVQTTVAKLPTSEQLDYGEIAINYAKNHETISIKNNNNEVVEFRTSDYILDTVAANFDELADIVEENEKVAAQGLVDLKDDIQNLKTEIENIIIENEEVIAHDLNALSFEIEKKLDKDTYADVNKYGVVKFGTNYDNGNLNTHFFKVGIKDGIPQIPLDSEQFSKNNDRIELKNGLIKTDVTWGESSDMNDLKTPGIYDIYGERRRVHDNLPINNSNPGHTIAGRLTVVDSTLKPSDGSTPTEICITQFLSLSNRTGGDGASYVRTYNEENGNGAWSSWQKQQGIVETFINTDEYELPASSFQNGQIVIPPVSGGLNAMINNGMYSGLYVSADFLSGGIPEFVETFVLVVINDYAAAGLMGRSRRISQLKYAIDTLTGENSIKKRIGTDNGSGGFTWTNWESIEYNLTKKVTYNELKSLKNNNLLIPGRKYEITDYYFTSTQNEVTVDLSENIIFSIIVEAINENTLDENAKIKSDELLESDKWEVKYCLDNDTSRFAWADTTDGRGVIYYMKDNVNNELPYDFTNVVFKYYDGENQMGGSEVPTIDYYYQFSNTMRRDPINLEEYSIYCKNNKVGSFYTGGKLYIPFVIFTYSKDGDCISTNNVVGENCNNIWIYSSNNNRIGNNCGLPFNHLEVYVGTAGNYLPRVYYYKNCYLISLVYSDNNIIGDNSFYLTLHNTSGNTIDSYFNYSICKPMIDFYKNYDRNNLTGPPKQSQIIEPNSNGIFVFSEFESFKTDLEYDPIPMEFNYYIGSVGMNHIDKYCDRIKLDGYCNYIGAHCDNIAMSGNYNFFGPGVNRESYGQLIKNVLNIGSSYEQRWNK